MAQTSSTPRILLSTSEESACSWRESGSRGAAARRTSLRSNGGVSRLAGHVLGDDEQRLLGGDEALEQRDDLLFATHRR